MAKTAAQLDAEIAESLRAKKWQERIEAGRERDPRRDGSERRQLLVPVEGLRIPADARRALNAFWRAHPALRKGCLDKYGFDPIDEEADYWRFGMAEPDHARLLRAVRRNDDVFSLALVRRWEAEELKHAGRGHARNVRRTERDRATRKQIPDAVRAAIEDKSLAIIQGLYRHHAVHGGKEPCVTVGLVADHLRQAVMPDDFRWATKDRQRTWTRSVLEAMRRRGQIGSSFGARARCYEPAR